MREPKWTHGPWFGGDNPDVIEDGDGHQLFAVQRLPEVDRRQHIHNRKLIVTAPELYAQLEDAKITLEEAAKILASSHPSFANNLVNQCAIRCGDALAKARADV